MLVGVNYLLSFHKITFSVQKEVSGATVYRSNGQKVKYLEESGTVLLRTGEYYVTPEGENVSQDKINFTVTGGDITVTIDPDYTKEYLAKLLVDERPLIKTTITEKYPTLISGYVIQKETLYKKGEWLGALLVPKVENPRNQKTPYHIVLHKKDGKWEVIRRPEYVLTSSRYSEVPIDILRQINSLVE